MITSSNRRQRGLSLAIRSDYYDGRDIFKFYFSQVVLQAIQLILSLNDTLSPNQLAIAR